MNRSMKNDRRDAASVYVKQRKWWIFPVPPGTKMGYSVKQRGHDNGRPWGATSDVTEIRAYWKRLPRANIGLVMGVDSGIWDLECDTVEGHANLAKDGAESLAELEALHGKLPPTLTFESPSGSRHHLFKHPGDDVRIRSGALDANNFPGIDIRGDGGMSVAPPSRTSKGTYQWISRRHVAAAPQWLLDMVTKPARAPHAVVSDDELPARETVILALALLPNDDPSYDFWKDIGMRIYASTGGTGFDLFDAWSRKWHGYNAADTRKAWDSEIATCPPDRYGVRAILNKIEEVMPEWQTATMTPTYDAQIKSFLELLNKKED
jgi:Bifunctional DNA primase/polymerase, N-terminal/Primase C terminal 2 (PriCT-2)